MYVPNYKKGVGQLKFCNRFVIICYFFKNLTKKITNFGLINTICSVKKG